MEQLFFLHTPRYSFHYDFAVKHFGERRPLKEFLHLFSDGTDRSFVLCTLVYNSAQDVWALELDSAEPMENDRQLLYTVFKDIARACFFGASLRFHAVSPVQEAILAVQTEVPFISSGEDW